MKNTPIWLWAAALTLGIAGIAAAQDIGELVGAAERLAGGGGDRAPTASFAVTLEPGQSENCEATQTCDIKCPKGKCKVRCGGSSTCKVDCPDGNCTLDCGGTANCSMACPKGKCKASCGGSSKCSTDCPKGKCKTSCNGTANCSMACPELVKKKPTCSVACGQTTKCACDGPGCKRGKKRKK